MAGRRSEAVSRLPVRRDQRAAEHEEDHLQDRNGRLPEVAVSFGCDQCRVYKTFIYSTS